MNKRVILIALPIIAFFVALAYYNSSQPDAQPKTDTIWNQAMVSGKKDAPNKIVEYGDYFCEYCTMFHEQATSETFVNDYLDTGKVQIETRPVTVLAGPRSPNAEQGVEAAFCAADQNKFEPFSDHIIPRIKKDYFDKGIGVKSINGVMLAQPKPIEKLPQSYFSESAVAAHMDIPTFEDCMKTEKHKDEIERNTQTAIRSGLSGLPHIVVNGHVSSGFVGGWDNFELMLRAGGIRK